MQAKSQNRVKNSTTKGRKSRRHCANTATSSQESPSELPPLIPVPFAAPIMAMSAVDRAAPVAAAVPKDNDVSAMTPAIPHGTDRENQMHGQTESTLSDLFAQIDEFEKDPSEEEQGMLDEFTKICDGHGVDVVFGGENQGNRAKEGDKFVDSEARVPVENLGFFNQNFDGQNMNEKIADDEATPPPQTMGERNTTPVATQLSDEEELRVIREISTKKRRISKISTPAVTRRITQSISNAIDQTKIGAQVPKKPKKVAIRMPKGKNFAENIPFKKKRGKQPVESPTSVREQRTSYDQSSDKSSLLFSSDLLSVWESMSTKKIISQRKLAMSDFTSKTGISGRLKNINLFNTVMKVEPYVRAMVYEFYTNLVPQLIEKGQVFVRGNLFEFHPGVINAYLGSSGVEDEFVEDMDLIAKELLGGQILKWISKNILISSRLSSTFALMHKIAHSNWMPSRQKGYVKRALAILLFKIEHGIHFNIGQLIYDQIIDARNGKGGRRELIFPNLVYGLLVMQGFRKKVNEVIEAVLAPITVDQRLFSGAHIDDTSTPEIAKRRKETTPDDPVASPSIMTARQRTIAYLRDQLRDLQTQKKKIHENEPIMSNLLSALLKEEEESCRKSASLHQAASKNDSQPVPAVSPIQDATASASCSSPDYSLVDTATGPRSYHSAASSDSDYSPDAKSDEV